MLGGVVIGLYEKKTGIAAEDLPDVMAKVKSTGRYEYDHLGKLSIAVLCRCFSAAAWARKRA